MDLDSIGKPQFIAAALLLVYLLECAWLIRVQTLHGALPDSNHAFCIYLGLEQWKGGPIAGTAESLRAEAVTGLPSAGRAGHLRIRDGYDQDRSPLYYLVAAAPFLVKPGALPADSPLGQVWAAAPYLFFGVMLGGSLWYVARRLYGNAGGYIAVTLYCFSPAMITGAAGTPSLGEMGGVWGAFGTVFTAIAVAHTLYAPREVVLWNGRRILLLGLSLTLVVGNQFSLAVLALVALAFMFWVAPVRPRAVIAIWAAAIAVAALLFLAAYFFRVPVLWQSISHALWIDFVPAALGVSMSSGRILRTITTGCPAFVLALPAALIAYLAWKRVRYFGNTAPLLVAVLMLVLAIGTPDFPGQGSQLVMLVFLFLFVAGVFADLLETRQSLLVSAGLCGLLIASALWNLLQLARLR